MLTFYVHDNNSYLGKGEEGNYLNYKWIYSLS